MLQTGYWCEKTRDRLLEVLRAKHPEARTLTTASLTTYTGCPTELTPVDIQCSSSSTRLLESGPPGVWRGAPLTTGPPFSHTGLPAVALLP